MMATRRALGSLPTLAFAFCARKSIDISPNCRPLGCARNTYLRLRFSSTAEEMQVVIHMNFLPCAGASDASERPATSVAAISQHTKRTNRYGNMDPPQRASVGNRSARALE